MAAAVANPEDATAALGEAEGSPGNQAARDHPRGFVGWVYEDIFKDLYEAPTSAPAESNAPAEDGGDGAEPASPSQGGAAKEACIDGEVDFAAEEEEILAIRNAVEAESGRLGEAVGHLREKRGEAAQQDREEAEFLQTRWGLTIREQVPVPDSKLRHLLHSGRLEEDGLVVPRGMMEDVERRTEITKGTINQHENLLAISKPEEPNHFRETQSVKIRNQARNISNRFTQAQRTAIAEDLEERRRQRPPMPPALNAEERERNREIVKRMYAKVNFLKNPRYLTDRKAVERGEACPFWFSPDSVVFRNYEVGGIYEIAVEFRNTTAVGRRIRVVSSKNPAFSLGPLRYENEGPNPSSVIAPGMAAHVVVHFAPTTLNDVTEELIVGTEMGDFSLPLLARRVQPQLDFEEPVNCGCILAGNTTTKALRVTNRGGEGSFRLIPAEDADGQGFQYETTSDGETSFVSGTFRVLPACFYLEADQSVDLLVIFCAAEVGRHSCALLVECDNGERTPLTLEAITDAVRLELTRWPTLTDAVPPPGQLALQATCCGSPAPGASAQGDATAAGGGAGEALPDGPAVGVSPWSLVPWQLSWLSPGTQIGCSESQELTISNGGYLPQRVEWRIVTPPRTLLSRLAVGAQQRLTEDLMAEMHTWPAWSSAGHGGMGCPFSVMPASALIEPFSSASFRFSFFATAPVGHRAAAFAYLVATDLPASGHCLPHFGRLVELQGLMQPEDYKKGLPLFGGAVSTLFDRRPVAGASEEEEMVDMNSKKPRLEMASCAVTAVCLQGLSTAPSVVCLPRVLALSGDVLPFVAHTREITLRNTGSMPAHFRVRITSRSTPLRADTYDPLWVVAPHEVGPRPPQPGPEEEAAATADGHQALALAAERLSRQWPPLPPEGDNASSLPGFGAGATMVVEPSEGCIPAGQAVKVKVTLRAVRESDLSTHLMVDFPVSLDSDVVAARPLKISVVAAVRSPNVELSRTSYLDYGVVRAHGRHTAMLCVDNPSDLPMLVRLRHHEEGDNPDGGSREGLFPISSHQEVVNFFAKCLQQGNTAGSAAVRDESDDASSTVVKPWVHARSGCLDKSGRRRYQYQGRAAIHTSGEGDGDKADDEADFIFSPECLALWPHQSAEVEVTLRTKEVGKYRAILEAVGFDSLHSQCIDVAAEVQLPQLRLSTQHAHFPVTYVRTTSAPLHLELRNDSDMPAKFEWDVPVRLEACLEVQIEPMEGEVPPRGATSLVVVACPTRELEIAELICQVFVNEVLQPLDLRVSARVYGAEVDYAIVAPGELPPEIKHEPRKVLGETEAVTGTCPILCGSAPWGAPTIDFGEMELQKSKKMQLVLYNRTGIATPFSLRVEKNPAYDPLAKGRKIGGMLDAATRMYSLCSMDGTGGSRGGTQVFEAQPQPASKGRQDSNERNGTGESDDAVNQEVLSPARTPMQKTGDSLKRGRSTSVKFDPKSRRSQASPNASSRNRTGRKKRFLLDDKHERQAFRSNFGVAFAQKKEMKEQGMLALKYGRGWAVKIEPTNDWLQPFSKAVVTITAFSDLPGLCEDELVVNIRQLAGHTDGEDFRIPVRLLSYGNPLYLPEQQVGLNGHLDPPRLLCGTMVPIEKFTTRVFKVGNNSAAKVRINWTIFPKSQVDNTADERQLLNVALCGKKGCADPFGALSLMDDEEGESDDEDEDEDNGGDGEMPFRFQMWAQDPPELKDPFALPDTGELPVKIEPLEAVIPMYGTASFTVTMTSSKTTTTAAGHYFYKLVGKGRFTEDREELLAAAAEEAQGPKAIEAEAQRTGSKGSSKEAQVRGLPEIQLDGEDLHDDDSDIEPTAVVITAQALQESAQAAQAAQAATQAQLDEAANGAAATILPHARSRGRPLAEEPEYDIISTIVVDCVGDCILPKLAVDKKVNPAVEEYPSPAEGGAESVSEMAQPVHCPIFKFTYSAVTPPMEKLRAGGVAHGGVPGGAQIPGVASCLTREIVLSNHNACNVSCRFRADGPYRIRLISQVGKHPVLAGQEAATGRTQKTSEPVPDPLRQLFVVAKWETVTLTVEFIPDLVPASEWTETQSEHIFKGDLVVEYPRDASDTPDGSDLPAESIDLQRIHLVTNAFRPAVKVSLVPNASLDRPQNLQLAHKPGWSEVPLVLVEFGNVHVDSSITRRRVILLTNETNVLAKWRVLHVGRKRRPPREIGVTVHEDEDFRALDDKDVFEFETSEGDLWGPSKDGLMPGSQERMPRWCPVTPALPAAQSHPDEVRYEPKKVSISFKPQKNELYKCRFRIQVKAGLSVDFICRGCGSYDEEDDAMDYEES